MGLGRLFTRTERFWQDNIRSLYGWALIYLERNVLESSSCNTQALVTMKGILPLFLGLVLCGPQLSFAGVGVQHNAIPNPEVFGLRFGKGQELYGRVRGINTVSLQTYLTPAYSVVEMVIDIINSPLQIRIYSTDLIDAVSLAADAASPVAKEIPFANNTLQFGEKQYETASGSFVEKTESVVDTAPVVKDYPLTTHSKTIEFKLPSAGDVEALFNAFNDLWLQKPEAIDEMESSDAETQATGRINPLSRTMFVLTN